MKCSALLLVVSMIAGTVNAAADGAARDDRPDSVAIANSAAKAIWSGSVYHEFSRFSESRPVWRTMGVNVRRRVPRRMTVDGEIGFASRHDLEDGYVALDVYRNFGVRSYGNLRFAVAPGADIMARTDAYAEFFHAPGGGWELSAGYRRADYTRTGTNTWTVGAAKYLGNWYLRVRQSVAEVRGSAGYALLATVRRYLGAPTEYVGVSIAKGREVLAFPGEDGVSARNPLSGSLFFQHHLGKGAGVRVGLEGVRDGTLSRWGFMTGLLWRR